MKKGYIVIVLLIICAMSFMAMKIYGTAADQCPECFPGRVGELKREDPTCTTEGWIIYRM